MFLDVFYFEWERETDTAIAGEICRLVFSLHCRLCIVFSNSFYFSFSEYPLFPKRIWDSGRDPVEVFDRRLMGWFWFLMFFSLLTCMSPSCKHYFSKNKYIFLYNFNWGFRISWWENADGYDPLDPDGHIAIKWDILQWSSSTYDVSSRFHSHFPSVFLGNFDTAFFLEYWDVGLAHLWELRRGFNPAKTERKLATQNYRLRVCFWWWPYRFVCCCCLVPWTSDLHRELSALLILVSNHHLIFSHKGFLGYLNIFERAHMTQRPWFFLNFFNSIIHTSSF